MRAIPEKDGRAKEQLAKSATAKKLNERICSSGQKEVHADT